MSVLLSDQPLRGEAIRQLGRALTFALIYYIADSALNRFAFSNGWTILWPLNGITIALLIMRPRTQWPAMLFGIELGTAIGEYYDNNVINSLGLEVTQRFISMVEVVLSAALLPPFEALEGWLRKPRIFWRFIAALFVGPIVSGVLAALYFHLQAGQSYLSAFDDWAPADALGIAAVMPLALSMRSSEMRELFRWRKLAKTLAVLTLCFGCAVAVFSTSRYPLLFLLFPALLFVDSLLDFSGSAIAVFVTSFIAVYYTTQGLGPFGVWPQNLAVTRDVAVQIYLGFQLVALFPASIMIMERKRMGLELRDTNAKLLELASLDGLTGIANRRAFDEYFTEEWNRAVRQETLLAFIMIDIDHFKQFNDLYGHNAGDQCLRAVANALKSEVLRPQDHLARFGGEEFSLLLPHTDGDGAVSLAERLRSAVMRLELSHRGSGLAQVTVSLGCAAMTPLHGDEKTLLLEMADAALYEAKRSGRNRSHSILPARDAAGSGIRLRAQG